MGLHHKEKIWKHPEIIGFLLWLVHNQEVNIALSRMQNYITSADIEPISLKPGQIY
jgi:hypothetical protein